MIDSAHVICMNDSVEYVVIGSEDRAKQRLADLRHAYWLRNRWSFCNDIEAYAACCYWHIHSVSAEADVPEESL